jgi:hypothetical protein
MTHDYDGDCVLGKRRSYPPFERHVNLIKSLIQE